MTSEPSVLFVDDESNVLESLKRLLLDEPYEVRTCLDPEIALEEITANAPTVVVADFYMPKMNGPELLKRVHAIDPGIVRMVLTGKPDVTAVLDAVRQGHVYRFILKPWDEDELRMALSQAIDYFDLVGERDNLQVEVSRQRKELKTLEESYPGITKLPDQQRGAFVLTQKDLPKGKRD